MAFSATRAARHGATLVLLLLLGGCGLFKPQTAIDIDALRTEHRYVSALSALEQNRTKTPDYLQQRQILLDEATLYQSQLLQSLRTLMEQQNYAQAQQLLQQATPELPLNAELTAFVSEFNRDRNRYVQEHLDELYQLRGEHLLKEQPLYQSLIGVASDDELQTAIERYQADVEYFSRLLRTAGTAAMEREDCALARKYLATANQLRPTDEVTAALDACTRTIDTRRERQQQSRASEREQRYRKIEAALQQALAKPDFMAARAQLGTLRETGLHSAEVERYQRQLDDAINTYVNALIDSGNRQYTEGHIEAALENWRNAYALTPTADVKERIEKAEKFIQRYQDLKQSPSRP